MRKQRTDFKNCIGMVFGRLTVISPAPSSKCGNSRWKCLCRCGTETIVGGRELRNGKTISCGCYQKECQSDRMKGKSYRKRKPYQWIYTILLSSAKRSERKCDISYDDFLKFTKVNICHYCGDIIPWSPHGKYKREICSYFLDRKDNSLDYTNENCVVCCSICNRAKGYEFSHDEMILLGPEIRQIKQLRQQNIKNKTDVMGIKNTPLIDFYQKGH